MASLSDDEVQQNYVKDCLKVWGKWQRTLPAGRRTKLLDCVNSAMTECDLPDVEMTGGGSPLFLPKAWAIRVMAEHLISDRNTAENFARNASVLYHEARHSEQFFRIAQGVANGNLALPGERAGDKARKFPESGAIAKSMGIPGDAALSAEAERKGYPIKDHALIESWYASYYGGASTHRAEVLAHLDMSVYDDERPDLHFKKYLTLPEERDAYFVQDAVLVRLADALELWA
jgi:hypothetical protein